MQCLSLRDLLITKYLPSWFSSHVHHHISHLIAVGWSHKNHVSSTTKNISVCYKASHHPPFEKSSVVITTYHPCQCSPLASDPFQCSLLKSNTYFWCTQRHREGSGSSVDSSNIKCALRLWLNGLVWITTVFYKSLNSWCFPSLCLDSVFFFFLIILCNITCIYQMKSVPTKDCASFFIVRLFRYWFIFQHLKASYSNILKFHSDNWPLNLVGCSMCQSTSLCYINNYYWWTYLSLTT